MNLNFSFLSKYWPMFVGGIRTTILLAAATIVIGLIVGVILALLRLSKFEPFKFFTKLGVPAKMAVFNPISFLATAYIEFMRGTPLLVQILFIFYALPQLGIRFPAIPGIGFDFPRFASGITAMGLNSGAYIGEIVRAGIQAVHKGQTEAALSVGMNKMQAMRYIVLPQAFKNILPALGNEFITVIKESSIVMVIGITELMFNTAQVYSSSYRYFESLIVCALIYFVATFAMSRLLGGVERKMRRDER